MPLPQRSSTLAVAGIGAVSIRRGSAPARAKSTKRARGVSPSAAAFSSLMISTADAPSVICDELPAVTRPPSSSGRNDGLSLPSDSIVVSRRPSSALTSAPSAPSTGRISRSKRPSVVARCARCWDWAPKRSMSSRVMPHLSAISSAEMPCGTSPPWSA